MQHVKRWGVITAFVLAAIAAALAPLFARNSDTPSPKIFPAGPPTTRAAR